MQQDTGQRGGFEIPEATLDDIRRAFETGELSCRDLVQAYLDRTAEGPAINSNLDH